MKGILTKTKNSWRIMYGSHFGREVWPVSVNLHPDDESLWMFAELTEGWKDRCEGKEVNFLIIEDGDVKYGKIITNDKLDNSKIEESNYSQYETKPGFVDRRMEQMLEITANEEFKKVGDDGIFPNHTDKDIWINGFKAGFTYNQKN